jgi:CYTH domain-containing protein
MGNGLEIERRFIMRNVPAVAANEVYRIFQKYAADGWRYRARISGDVTQYYKTRKTAVSNGVNEEEEHEIDVHTFHNCGPVKKGIHKTRHVYAHNGLKYEVDEFHHISLVIMEVELDAIDQQFELPDFIADMIICEVTGIKELSNSMLARPEYVNIEIKNEL